LKLQTRLSLKVALLGAGLLQTVGTSHAFTQNTTATFHVGATIVAQCIINSTTDLSFGTGVGVIAADINQTFSNVLSVQCTNSTAYAIGLSAGLGATATVAARQMTGPGSATVTYALYQDSGYSTVWGTTPATDTVGATGNGAPQTYTIYGKVPTQTTPAPGAYQDTITVTVYY